MGLLFLILAYNLMWLGVRTNLGMGPVAAPLRMDNNMKQRFHGYFALLACLASAAFMIWLLAWLVGGS